MPVVCRWMKCFVRGCRLLIIAGDCETICDVLLDVIPMLEEASAVFCLYLTTAVVSAKLT